MRTEPKYWVEADRAVKDYSRVIGYSVWHISEAGGRQCVHRFSVNRWGGVEVALHLANTLRDDFNAAREDA